MSLRNLGGAVAQAGLLVIVGLPFLSLMLGGIGSPAGASMPIPSTTATDLSTTFSGSCSLTGMVTFSAPIGLLPAERAHQFVGSGTCTGKLNGVAVAGAPVSDVVTVDGGYNGCLANVAFAGAGSLVFFPGSGQQATVGFDQTTAGAGDPLALVLSGNAGGVGLGTLTFPLTASLIAQCASRTLASSPVSVSMSTLTPFVA